MTGKTAKERYEEAVEVAKKITGEMSWVYANNQVSKSAREQDVLDKFYNTSANHVLILLIRSTLNEVLVTISMLIDKDQRTTSIFTLKSYLEDVSVQMLIEENYTQAEGTFNERKQDCLSAIDKLETHMKDHKSVVRKLIIFRKDHLVHKSIKSYQGSEMLKIGDEKELIKLISEVVDPMEHILLNSGNMSVAINSNFESHAKNFWDSFTPKRKEEE